METERVENLLHRMLEINASDIFLTAEKPPYCKINMKMSPLDNSALSSEEIENFRKRVLLPASEKEFKNNGNFDAGITLEKGLRFRINFLMQQGLPAMVARVVPSGDLNFKELQVPGIIADFSESRRGLVLVAGPAGSGKSTTVAAMINHINSNFSKHIVTIEDPVEFIHKDKKSFITQREIGADSMSFSSALKHVVREAPDVIFIGEMRDMDTVQTAIQASLTGHLVLTTLHSSNVEQCIKRIINHFPEHLRNQAAIDLSLALKGIVAQRLVSKKDKNGMLPSTEILNATPLAKHLIAEKNFSGIDDVIKRGEEDGMHTFARNLAELCKEKKISVEEGARASTNSEEFLLLTQGMESGIDTFRKKESENHLNSDQINMKRLLDASIANHASDLLISAHSAPSLRVNGEISPLETGVLTPSDTKRLLFGILNAKQREEFEENKEIDFALTVELKRNEKGRTKNSIPNRFRVNGFYQRGTVSISLRVIPGYIPNCRELEIPKTLIQISQKKQGLILVTGPTGHGKSTTLASLISAINKKYSRHIITVEDPIEYVHKNEKSIVEQREVYADTLSFATALKYVLRQDPDVILVGEMRDPETISAALTAAETGHLVMATLHTNNASQTIDRIIDSFPAHQQNQIRLQLAGTLECIVAQRLLPRKNGDGRIAAFEMMIGTPAVRALIRENKTHMAVSQIETSAKDGMITIDKALRNLFDRNLISRKEAISHMANPSEQEMSSL